MEDSHRDDRAVGTDSNSCALIVSGERKPKSLKPPIQQPILHRLGHVVLADLLAAVHVGDRPRDAADLVVRPRAQAQLVHRLLHQQQAQSRQIAELLELLGCPCGRWWCRRRSACAGRPARGRPARASCALLVPGCLPVSSRYGTAGTSTWMSMRSSSGPRQLRQVFVARAGRRRCVAAGGGVHRGDQHELAPGT